MQAGEVGIDHDLDQLRKANLGLPAKSALGFGRVAHQQINFRGALVADVVADKIPSNPNLRA